MVESPTYFAIFQLIERPRMLALEIRTSPETLLDSDPRGYALASISVKAVADVASY